MVHEGDKKAAESHPAERCRACGARVAPDSPSYPFCSARCRSADLGKWFSEGYRISRAIKDSDLEESD